MATLTPLFQACTFSDAFAGSGTAAVVPSPYYVPKSKFGAMTLAPSSAASFANYAKLQKDRLDAPFFLSGRPITAKVTMRSPLGIKSYHVCVQLYYALALP